MRYINKIELMEEDMLDGGFFDGWPNPPSVNTHFKLLKNSHHFIVAIDEKSNKAVGFITAISDGILSAYIPFLEVLPAYQKIGIGRELVERMLEDLNNLYMIDLLCDERLQGYYEKVGMSKASGMMKRYYKNQNGSTT